ncbi:hypothetical protein Glove_225g6 [Diversispora epigaea]|uniref:Uncharacterized protein n=1 Tax=Diversispora epigaea TaxID=1348612 RepID=A0A397IKU6_9GLOM|nr:hypothetical protein Glove_225g6 [Diversispora epigaea]
MINENNKFSEIVNIFDDSNLEFSDNSKDDNEDKFLDEEDKSLSKTKINIPSNSKWKQ